VSKLCIVDFMPATGQRRAAMSTDMQALSDLLREAGFRDIIGSRRLPSMGFLVGLLGIAPPGFVAARKAGD
jgi:hypothetical protein